MAYQLEKETAISAVMKAAKLCQQVRKDIPPALEKQDKSPVTVADFGSQAIICKVLKEVFPDTPIVGEEDSKELRQETSQDTIKKITTYVQEIIPSAKVDQVLDWIDYGNGTVSHRFWTLDPIDGTKGFLRQDQYAVALALIEDREVKLGILGCPALTLDNGDTGFIFVAVKGEGSYKMSLSGGDITKLQVVSNDDISRFRFVESVEANHGDQIQQNAIAKKVGITTDSVRVDSQAKYGIVAAGEAALYLRLPSPKYPNYRENIWDHAAGAIVVEEAGGKVTDMYGKPLDFATASKMNDNRGVVVSNGLIHDSVIQALNN
ncbi:MAG: 3'(2'),5'-bisphosphate nucleotidase [Cyanobacteria bacterium]|nr:3'(2'),5'-bisphosphate nucleotidase [Cyanobacteria bacterium CG_2015-16_32_12]NCO78657.1 3'(2'),5'-bisphosphate nucleotidase [Cyanobacteria bacterium CG_2015-22_32_23]NCQ04340.1 3'(2'),5'-bisphosphate nucleotidase [Cyanobacteria bacterium CG_2015-09_32_10]NCQ42782.1 3'(2'),5'-bisphosphate nucleotidase [Cyanobacteria bacterium CG_2015-04_32_10]NCS84781.1 3'(2'),5'-bisphosphate nucleotidase [Cyanobacteria bacterium CG_2015-02_32_10]